MTGNNKFLEAIDELQLSCSQLTELSKLFTDTIITFNEKDSLRDFLDRLIFVSAVTQNEVKKLAATLEKITEAEAEAIEDKDR
ncbi:hypothetical protein [Limosilactobacillus ingluviei]|uniref:hypothetical protein n=1 Tax=Limosilactobacillus ingluviei TaxID=148604 RepID=UPI0024B9767F|nr:hypothetical protein [Limosilactobacillus ingluviei]